MGKYTTVIVECALDWATYVCDDDRRKGVMRSLGADLVRMEAGEGNKLELFGWRGYKGEHSRRATWGERADGVLVQCSRGLADETFRGLYPYCTSVPRLDLQVTARIEPYRANLASETWKSVLRFRPEHGLGPSSQVRAGSDGGSTLYIGASQSIHFGRLYNKWVERRRRDYHHCWRWEVQLKAELASSVAGAVFGSANRPAFCQGYVWDWFSGRGAEPEWGRADYYLPSRPVRPKSDAATKLQWLDQTVRPTVEWLIDAGYEEHVRQTLGLWAGGLDLSDPERMGGAGNHKPAIDDGTGIDTPMA